MLVVQAVSCKFPGIHGAGGYHLQAVPVPPQTAFLYCQHSPTCSPLSIWKAFHDLSTIIYIYSTHFHMI